MILKSLRLQNFRKFKDIFLEFPDGVTGVIGLNGVGKSTIFEGVAWALYGSVAARTSASEIRRVGSENCRAELEFEFEDEEYRIVREMHGKSTSSSLLINGKLAATGAEAVTKYIQKKIGMDFRSFFTSIFAKQKELNALSSMNASERRPLILKMLGIDAIDSVIKEIRTDKKNKEQLIEKLGLELVDERGRSKIDNYSKEIEELEKKKGEIYSLIKRLREDVSYLKEDLKEVEEEYKIKRKEYEEINKKKEKLSEKKTLFEIKQKIEEEIESLTQVLGERKKIVKIQKEKIKELDVEKEMVEVEDRLCEIDRKIEDKVKGIEQKKTFLKNYQDLVKEIESKKNRIEEMGPDAKCPTCERVLGKQYYNLIVKLNKEKTEKELLKNSLLKDINKLELEKDKLSRMYQALEKRKRYLNDLFRERERIQTTIKNMFKEIEREESRLKEKRKHLLQIGEIEYDPQEFKFVKKKVEQLYERYQRSLSKFDKKKDELNNLLLNLEKKEGERNLLSHEIKNLKERIEELESFKKKIKEEKKKVKNLDMLDEVMSSFRTYLISRIRPTLSYYASDFFERLTDGKYRLIELDEDYNLIIYDDGVPYRIERFSGGEEDLANLCLRLAISEVITERAGGAFNFIILDEIFGSQDNIRKQNIMKALKGFSSKFRQIFLITHIEEIKNFIENAITVYEEEDGTSRIKVQ